MKRASSLRAELALLKHLPGLRLLAMLVIALTVLATVSGLSRLNAAVSAVNPLQVTEQDTRNVLQKSLQRHKGNDNASQPVPLAAQPGALGFTVLNEYVVMPHAALAPLAAGVSDLLPRYYRFDAHAAFMQDRGGSIDNPLRLAAGSFDLAFVLVFLMPVMVIAMSYDIMSRERELGVLALVGAQGVSLRRFIGAKMLLRGAVIFSAIVVSNLIAILLISILGAPPSLISALLWLLVAVLYGAVWFGLACVVNAAGLSSSTNGVLLANLWLLIVIVLPAIIQLFATSIYPAPSRVDLTTELREASAEAEERATAAREQYFFDHPDLAGTDVDPEQFYRDVASGEHEIAQSIAAQLQAFDDQAGHQARIVAWMKYASPALLAEQSFSALAGTDRNYHAQFKSAAFDYHSTWRSFFVRRLESKTVMTTNDWTALPTFAWRSPGPQHRAARVVVPIAVLFALALLLVSSALFFFRRYSPIQGA